MTQDPQFGVVSTLQTLFPEAFMATPVFRTFMKLFMPETRPMDNMKLSIDAGQEEELAMCNMCPYSFYYGWVFPNQMIEHYEKYIRFEGESEATKSKWKAVYQRMLKIATINAKGRRIILKNPPNTARIKLLMEMYPDAKFIHIHRNPYIVYLSTKTLYKKAVAIFHLQKISEEQIEKNIFEIYTKLTEDYLKEVSLIPSENFVEIGFGDLEKDPMDELKKVYKRLNLPGFEEAVPRFQEYLDSLGSYKKNKYNLDQSTIEKIEKHWKFAIDKWGYSVPE
jgi:hypothetical protein